MVDPIHFTNFSRTIPELEEVALFSVLVAGKNALSTAKALDNFLSAAYWRSKVNTPFKSIKPFSLQEVRNLLYDCGIGCQTMKGKAVYEMVRSNIDLKNCSVDEMEDLYGIGLKTSRMFIMHTRPNIDNIAVLDVHILRYLSDLGYNVPKVTPSSKTKYRKIEEIFLKLVANSGMSLAEYDLKIWNLYRLKS